MLEPPPPPPSVRSGPGVPSKPSVAEKASPVLAGAITWLSTPFVTAREQPPAPGSNWFVRLWHSLRKIAGHVLDVLPKKTTIPLLLLRLTVAILIWVVIVSVVFEVVGLWLLFVAPIVWLAQRSNTKTRKQKAAVAARHAPPVQYRTVVVPAPPPPAPGPAPILARLATAPDPAPVPANANCPMCGGPTTGAREACLFCDSPLPMVAKRGWHPDPLGSGARRWFDGTAWTEHTQMPQGVG